MPDNESSFRRNPILSVAFGMIENVVPGGMSDTEKALRELVPTLRYLVVAPVALPTRKQMDLIRSFREFEMSNLLQTRQALRTGAVRLGPFPEHLAAETFVPVLLEEGLSVSMEEMTEEEKIKRFGFL